jgi:hypothetical protein
LEIVIMGGEEAGEEAVDGKIDDVEGCEGYIVSRAGIAASPGERVRPCLP